MALAHVDIAGRVETLHHGDRVRLVGPNGSGKTTLLRALRKPSWAYLPDRARDALVGLTVAGEARLRRMPLPPHWTSFAARPVTELSHGEARRLALDLLPEAPVLLLDEPAEGLDASATATLRQRLRSSTCIFTDHSGALADLATQTWVLGTEDAVPWPEAPLPQGDVVLEAPPLFSHVHAPALALPAGVHIITGPNGRGKTTWLRHLAGLVGPGAAVRGQQAHLGRHVAWLGEDAAMTIPGHRVADFVPQSPLADRHPLALSRGEAQRVALERALAHPADVLLLDEPERHLDQEGRAWLAQQLAARPGCTIIATHDPQLSAWGQEVEW